MRAHEIDVSILEPEWNGESLDAESLAMETVLLTIRTARLPAKLKGKDLSVAIVLANDDLIHVLNKQYRNMDKPTNVLSFAQIDSDTYALEGEAFPIGDIVIAYQTVEREAREQGKYLRDHLVHMLVHGTLHLLGYDHQTEDEATSMESLEIRILESLNIQNPYMENFSMA